MRYEFAPGRLGASRRWPAQTAMTLHHQTATVLVFLHPRCVCSRATVAHLVRSLHAWPEAHVVAAVFVPPDAAEANRWREAPYVRAIREGIPGADIVFDPGAVEAQRFGAITSGTVLVFDPHGTEIFRGGITGRRGVEGRNPGLSRLLQALAPGSPSEPGRPLVAPVFGCPLVQERDV